MTTPRQGRARRMQRARRGDAIRSWWLNKLALLAMLVMTMILLSDCTTGASVMLPNLRSPIRYPASAVIKGSIRSPGGPFLYDKEARVVFFHGVNAVYKLKGTQIPIVPISRDSKADCRCGMAITGAE